MLAKYRIALISPEYPPNISGGVGVHVAKMTASLNGKVRQDLFVPQFRTYSAAPPSTRIHEVGVPQSLGELEFWLRFCHAAVVTIEKQGMDAQLIHCHDWMTALAGIRLRQLLKIPLVFNVHLPAHAKTKTLLEELGLVVADMVIVNRVVPQ